MKSRTSDSRDVSARSASGAVSGRAPGTGKDRSGTGKCREWAPRKGTEAASLATGCSVGRVVVCAAGGTTGNRLGNRIGIELNCSIVYFAASSAAAIKAVH